MEQAKIDRINALAHKAKEEGLSEDERIEQESLRMEYLQAIRQNMRSQIENWVLVNEDGTHRHIHRKPKETH